MQNAQILCDYCNEILSGIDKKAEVKKDFIQITGQVQFSEVDDDEFYKRLYFNLTKFSGNGALVFCNTGCFGDWIKLRIAEAKPRILEAIRTRQKEWEETNERKY